MAVFCLLHLMGINVYFKVYVSREVTVDTMGVLGISHGEIAKNDI